MDDFTLLQTKPMSLFLLSSLVVEFGAQTLSLYSHVVYTTIY